ncbi:hypothetical protein MNBD_NITROSPINAE03-2023 [hydrothermal vent metagenome]|uniref:Uncharacterized protein n=1 Tax=hydrothermal vent metagenome TaxID=652676 RepID=A0A3B1CED7_9ZZZZ
MLKENFKYFIDNYDFDMLFEWINNADWLVVLMNPYVLVPIIIVLGLMFYPKTSAFGQNALIIIPAIGYLFVTFVILKNDIISSIGPFIMAGVAFFGIVGTLIYTQLLKD